MAHVGLVLVEALVTRVSAGVQLAVPRIVIAGPPNLDQAFTVRGPIVRADMKAADSPIEAAYDQLKTIVRRAHISGTSRRSS